MKKAIILAILAATMLSVCLIPGESDASYSITYGSDSVGAEKIVFDSNGGSGGYAQYVLNGNQTFFPTEYKESGLSNSTYSQILKDGYVLLGWSESRTSSIPQYYPGQSNTVTSDRTFYAVWQDLTYDCIERFGGSSDDLDCEAQHILTTRNGSVTLTVNDETGSYALMRSAIERGTMRYILTVTHDGQSVSSTANDRNTTISADWVTLSISNSGTFGFSGTPASVGVYCIQVEMLTKGLGGSYGDLEDLFCRWYVSVADSGSDSSNIMHATYEGEDIGYGPFHTAVKLPDSVSLRQKGWNVTVDGSPAIFPVGGSYTLVKKETVLSVSEYTFDEVSAAGIAGVIAYNANGGSYTGAFAELVPIDGYQGLKSGSIVSKEGYDFLGWNPTGSPDNPIFPIGYLYDIVDGYTELKAVWVQSPTSTFKVHMENPSDGNQNSSFDAVAGYRYMLPVHGFEVSGYDFIGWSGTKHAMGTGSADLDESFTADGSCTYYAVYRPLTYSFSIHYEGGAGSGQMPDQTAESTSVPYYMTILGSVFTLDGYEFIGWAQSKFADCPSFQEGDAYRFTESGTVTLYAVWKERIDIPDTTEDMKYLYTLLFVANGQDATNIPSGTYRITSETTESFYVPSTAPQREGYRFMGWSETATGLALYEPGAKITLRIDGGQTSATLTLYAVWESSNPHSGDGTEHTVTFVGESGTLRTSTVRSGNSVGQISAPAKEGFAFLGWYRDSSKWDFASPVTSDMTLTAMYLKVFHLEPDGCNVKVVMDCSASSVSVAFSDGFSASYDSTAIPGHEVPAGTGSVSVTAVTDSGTYSAVCHYTANGQEEDETSEGFDWILAGIIAALSAAVVLVAWRFLL
ncbi:MAG: hypothetical protein E7Z70_01825 [Thermoplasmata archaeon]|nr:hypothetical protein [Thermoplasmata archaeon]